MADKGKVWLEQAGARASAWVAEIAANPYAQIGVIVFCALWWIVGLPTDILTAGLSILAITLTQMVLNRQGKRELDAHRRDLAMHTKLDELVMVTQQASNRFVGIEDSLEEEEIQTLKEEIRETIAEIGDGDRPPMSGDARRAAEEPERPPEPGQPERSG